MRLDDYSRFDAVGLAELVCCKEVTPEELLQATVAAIARVNPRFNAVIDVREAEVPLYWNADGLPIGVQFAGRFADEATLFRLAAGQLEEARPWAGRKPKVHVTNAD